MPGFPLLEPFAALGAIVFLAALVCVFLRIVQKKWPWQKKPPAA